MNHQQGTAKIVSIPGNNFQLPDILPIVESYGVALKRDGKEWKGLCPFHDEKTPSFFVNDRKNMFKCFGCEAKGNSIQFVMQKDGIPFKGACEKLGIGYEPTSAVEWFLRRGISEFTLFDFRITSENGKITFPYLVNGWPVNSKYRMMDSKKMWVEPGKPKPWYNQDVIKDYDTIYICEGEIDLLSIYQSGFPNVISVFNGTNAQFDAELLGGKKIIIAVDGDGAGQLLAEKIKQTFGIDSCTFVQWPGDCKDANDVLVKHGKTVLVELLKNPVAFEAPPEPIKAIQVSHTDVAADLFRFRCEKGAYILTGLYYDGVRTKLQEAGFYKRYTSPTIPILVRERGCILSETTTEQIRDFLMAHIESLPGIYFEFNGLQVSTPKEYLKEIFEKHSHLLINETWLMHLANHDKPLLKDTATTTNFFFRNGVYTVSKDSQHKLTPWAEVKDKCVWESQLLKHEFTWVQPDGCHFDKFLQNVCGNDEQRLKSILSLIGYNLNNSFNPTKGQALVLYDSTITDIKNPSGGSGKGIIANAIAQMRSMVTINGKDIGNDARFNFELIKPSTQNLFLDDVKPTFDFTILFSHLTNGFIIERKMEQHIHIKPEDSPKTIITSNSIIKAGGSSTIRRMYIFELGNHYSSKIKSGNEQPVLDEHGCIFFSSDWDQDEWNRFYSVMVDAADLYITGGVSIAPQIHVEENRLKQNVPEGFVEWVKGQNFETGKDYDKKPLYADYDENNGTGKTGNSMQSFTNYLKAFAKFKGWEYYGKQAHGKNLFRFSIN